MSSMQQKSRYEAGQIGHLTGKFSTVQPGQFRDTMNGLWQSAQTISEAVADEVEAERISTVQGAAVVANVTGSIFGWPEFHRELRPSDLALSLLGQTSGDGQ